MESRERYYRKLVEGYINKTLTKRETTVFFDLLSKGELDFYLEEDMLTNAGDEPVYVRQRNWISYGKWAAAVLLLLSIPVALYLIYSGSIGLRSKEDAVSKNIIVPGKEHAVLTLSNGEHIILDSSGQEEYIQEDNALMVNSKRGVLQYDLSKLDPNLLSEGQLLEKYHSIETPRGGTYQIVLPDGSTVWLNSLSKIKFPLNFGPKERRIEMAGEVFFDVAKDRNKPFVVESNGQEIKVLGTSFNVNAYADEPYTSTTLLTGKVELNNPRSSISLMPGEVAINTGAELIVQNADVQQAIAWKEGYFRFDKVDIPTLMRQISRWYKVHVEYDGVPPSERFVGKIKRTAELEDILKIFNQGGMNVSLEGRTIRVKR